MSRDDRVAERSAPVERRSGRDGYTPSGSAGPEDVPQGAFQPPPAPGESEPPAEGTDR